MDGIKVLWHTRVFFKFLEVQFSILPKIQTLLLLLHRHRVLTGCILYYTAQTQMSLYKEENQVWRHKDTYDTEVWRYEGIKSHLSRSKGNIFFRYQQLYSSIHLKCFTGVLKLIFSFFLAVKKWLSASNIALFFPHFYTD